MGLLDKLKSMLASDKLDVEKEFELIREAIHGTMSQFYVARRHGSTEKVGLKLLDIEKSAIFEGRFKGLDKPSEGEIALQLKHPRLVETTEFGVTTTGHHYLVMEYIDGHVLSVLIADRSTKLRGKRYLLIRQMAQAVEAVHEAGFIHRDICPRNFIANREVTSLKLIDFGLTLPARKEFMRPGNRTGTPNYMSPEIARRRPTDQRVDIFSFGVAAYQLCTFELPWPAFDPTGKAAMSHDTIQAVDILERQPKLNRQLAEVITACISVKAGDRPESMSDVLRMLRTVQSDADK